MTTRERHLIRPVLTIGALALLSASPALAEGPDGGLAAQGAVIYSRYCRVCHGTSGAGDGTLADSLRTAPTDLTLLARKNGGEFPLEAVIRAIDGRDTYRGHGTQDMPAWGDAFKKTKGTGADTPERAIEQLAHYVWELQKPADPK